eukprot:1676625-Rhodomonas_salina.2
MAFLPDLGGVELGAERREADDVAEEHRRTVPAILWRALSLHQRVRHMLREHVVHNPVATPGVSVARGAVVLVLLVPPCRSSAPGCCSMSVGS